MVKGIDDVVSPAGFMHPASRTSRPLEGILDLWLRGIVVATAHFISIHLPFLCKDDKRELFDYVTRQSKL